MRYRTVSRICILMMLWLLCHGQSKGQTTDQNYPVTAQAFVVAQPAQKLSAYFSGTKAVSVSLLLKDLTKNSIDVYLRWSIEGAGVHVASMDGYIPPGYINLQRGLLRRMSGLDLQADYFYNQAIDAQGLPGLPLNTSLPEGFYTFRVTAIEAGTGRQVSNVGETYFSITAPLPPIINIPLDGAELSSGNITRPVNIQWMPRHYKLPGNVTSYDLKVCKVPEGYEPTEALDACVSPIIDDRANPGTFYPSNTGIGNSIIGQWERGARYAVRVTVHELSTDGSEVAFANEGRSEVVWFRYGSACVSPPSFRVKEIGAGRLQLSWEAQKEVSEYNVLYRKEGETKWNRQTATDASYTLTGLGNERYEIAVQSGCTNDMPGNIQAFAFEKKSGEEEGKPVSNPLLDPVIVSGMGSRVRSDSLTSLLDSLKIPCTAQVNAYENCDIPLPEVNPSGTKPLQSLSPGDVLTIYDMAVIVTKAESQGGVFSGTGFVRIPQLGSMSPVEFSGVKAWKGEEGTTGGCVYEIDGKGYFRTRGAGGGELAKEKAQLIASLIRPSADDSKGVYFAGTMEEALKELDSLSKNPRAHAVLIGALQDAVATKTEDFIAKLKAENNPASDTLRLEIRMWADSVRKGASGGLEGRYKDIIDAFNHPVPPSPKIDGKSVILPELTVSDLCSGGAGYDPLKSSASLAGATGGSISCPGKLDGSPYWVYTSSVGEISYITSRTNTGGRVDYYVASEVDWRSCGRSPAQTCPGLWQPMTLARGDSTLNEPEIVRPRITQVKVNSLTSNAAGIAWAGDATFARYVITYTAPGGGALSEEVNATEVQLLRLQPSTNYTFTIQGYGKDNQLLDTYLAGSFNTASDKLPKPENVVAVAKDTTSVVITWDQNKAHDKGYELTYTDSIGMHSLQLTTNRAEISGLDPTLTYNFTLKAFGSGSNGEKLESEQYTGTFKTGLVMPCEDELTLNTQLSDDLRTVTLTWSPIKGQAATQVAYYKADPNVSDPVWTDLGETTEDTKAITDLKVNNEYVFRAVPVCSTATDPHLKGRPAERRLNISREKKRWEIDPGCGKPNPPMLGTDPLTESLQIGDEVLIGGFPAEILTLESNSAPYKGTAAVLVPYLGMSRYLMEFTGLTVNEFYQSIAGELHTIDDPALAKAASDARNQQDASKENQQEITRKEFDKPVINVVVQTDPSTGEPVLDEKGRPTAQVTLEGGEVKTVLIEENTTIVGSDGKEVAIAPDGTMSPTNGSPVSPATAAVPTAPGNVGDGSLIVRFSQDDSQKFGFDGVDGSANGVWGRDNFKLGDNDYYVPIKSVRAGVEDVIQFSLTGEGALTFSLESEGKSVTVQPEGNLIRILAPYAGNYALFAKDNQGKVVGKLTILSYPMVTKNVVLVSLNNSAVPDASSLQTELNKIFSQGVASVNVSKINFESKAYQGSIAAERDHYKYSADMKAIVSEFKKSTGSGYKDDKNTVYLFFGNTSTSGLEGVMNRGYQFGFIFNPNADVIAHELGHGLFALEHTENDNSNGKAEEDLMGGSSTGTAKLYKYQWAQMQDPPAVWGIMESGEDAEYQDPSKKCKVFLIHGTESSSSRWIENKNTIPILLKIAGCPNFDYKFNWDSPINNDAKDRSIAANQLKAYILAKSKDNDEIILIGHSHGGNVALQVVDKLAIIRHIRVITVATPAYNELMLWGSKNPENPANILNLKAHIALWNKIDGVSGGAAGDDFFRNSETINVEIDVSKYYKSNEYIDAHSFDIQYPESILEAINKGLVSKIY